MRKNKIIVVVEPDERKRELRLTQELVNRGFALNRTDARKLIRKSPHDFNLDDCHFVAADLYNLRSSSTSTTFKLVELSAKGILVLLGIKRLPPEFELFCESV